MLTNILLVGVLICLFILPWLMMFVISRSLSRYLTRVLSSLSPDADGNIAVPKPIVAALNLVAQVLTSHLSASIKGTLGGLNSVNSRNEKSLEVAMGMDMLAANNPKAAALIAGAQQLFPQASKIINKHPELLGAFLSRMPQAGTPPPAGVAGGNGHDEFQI